MHGAADYYAILGVGPEAESGAIRIAYRNLMRRYHPDVNSSQDAAAKATAINEAYDCLGDAMKRADYDRRRAPPPRFHPSAASAAYPQRRPTFRPSHTYRVEIQRDLLPRRWNRASLGLATVLTAVTFALTAATPPPMPLPPEPVVMVATGVGTETAMPEVARCGPGEQAADAPCARQAPRPAPAD